MPTHTKTHPPTSRCAPAASRLTFQFKPQHRNVPAEDLLLDLQQVAKSLGLPTLTQAAYRRHGRFNPLTFTARFGSWNNALAKARLAPSRHFRVPANAVLADVRRVARKLKTKHLLLEQYVREGKYSLTLIYRHYQTWSNLVTTAGLAPSTYHPRTTDRALFENLEKLWRHLNRQPTCTDLIPPHSAFGLTPYQRRFGGFQPALQAFVDWTHHRIQNPPMQNHKTTRHINWRLRYQILKQDHFKCRSCGRSPATDPNVRLQVDHIIPWSTGGETIAANLQTLCDQCNVGKSNL